MNMKIKCPNCRKVTSWENNKYRPFCSKRCKLIDLGEWADEKFKIEDKVNRSSINIGLVGDEE